MADDFEALRGRYRRFNQDRDWNQFHDPKSLILALVGEVGELAELFQWVPADRAQNIFSQGERQKRAGEEISDILLYLMGLADSLHIDIVAAAHGKLSAAERRFPVSGSYGVAPFKE